MRCRVLAQQRLQKREQASMMRVDCCVSKFETAGGIDSWKLGNNEKT